MLNNVALLSLPLLAAGAHHGHRHHHAVRDHGLQDRSAALEVVTVTDMVYVTVTIEPPMTSSAVPSSSIRLTSSSSLPVVLTTLYHQ
jgi:hypothetical protein